MEDKEGEGDEVRTYSHLQLASNEPVSHDIHSRYSALRLFTNP